MSAKLGYSVNWNLKVKALQLAKLLDPDFRKVDRRYPAGVPGISRGRVPTFRYKYKVDLEREGTSPRYIFKWEGADGMWHQHVLSIPVWHNGVEPGKIDEEELKLLRVKVKLTTC